MVSKSGVIATPLATGGQFEISAAEIALGCSIGGAGGVYGALGSTAGESAVNALDTYITLSRFL